jgi:hypothetical protein
VNLNAPPPSRRHRWCRVVNQNLIGNLETRLIRWMFLFWVGTIGTMITLLRFGGG